MTRSQVPDQPERLLSPGAQSALLAFILTAVTLAVYAPVKQHPWVSIDDYGYVVGNFHIQQLNWDTVKWSFTTFHYSNWDPLTWLSHALDCRLFGLDPGRHHETSLLLHTLNALLLFWLLVQATGYLGRSFAVAALFALHPVNVEAVAWVSERKTVLSLAFFLLALIAYTWYARRPSVSRYILVAPMFALALLAKPQVITLPFVLLLWDYWPFGRMFSKSGQPRDANSTAAESAAVDDSGKQLSVTGDASLSSSSTAIAVPGRSLSWLLLEKLPLLALSAASALFTMQAQWANRTMNGLNSYSLASRVGNAIMSYVRYLGNAVWPMHLSFFYPHAHDAPPAWQLVAALLLLLLITWLALASSAEPNKFRFSSWRPGSRPHRYLAVGWLWFVGTLVPMIQIVQIGAHGMADRYAYLPFIGLFIAVCWGVADWAEQWHSSRVWLPAGTVVLLLLLTLATRRQVNYWSDDLTLWTHSAQAIRNNWMAEELIGETLVRNGDWDAAIGHFRAAAAMDPLFPYPRLQIGIYEENHRHPREAIEQFQKVIDLTQSAAEQVAPLRSSAFVHMSSAYNQLGDYVNQQKYMTLAAHER